MKFIDISVPLGPDLPGWPGSTGFSRTQKSEKQPDGDIVCNSQICCDVHCGTHIDAPAHHLSEGATVDALPLDILIGVTTVIDVQDAASVTVDVLEKSGIPPKTARLLIKTSNSQLWNSAGNRFVRTYVGIRPDAAAWIVRQGIRLIGIDYLSVQCFDDGPKTHTILLGAGVIIVEGLNLTAVGPGLYHLICLPLNIPGSEGAPARVVVYHLNPGENP